jgi:hypothetical protein
MCFMKKFFNPVFAASLSLFALTIAIVAYCLADDVTMSNFKCMVGTAQYNCYTAGNLYCMSPPPDAICIFCGTEETTTSLPYNSCIPEEGAKCVNDGSAGANCEGLKRHIAACVHYDSPWHSNTSCGRKHEDGVCDGANNFMPCRNR